MGRAQREWAARKRIWLVAKLGNQCVDCGSFFDLEFDVIVPIEEGGGKPRHHRKMSIDQRISFYCRQLEANPPNVTLRCARCNGRKGATHDKKVHAARRQSAESPVS